MERPTFSPFWHRVSPLKPRLRPHVNITRQRYRGRRWHVVHDPASNQFYRLSPVAHDFVCSLDGQRNIEDAWKLSLAKFGDSSPTQNEVIELLSQLYNSNLLAIDTTPETEQLLQRGRDRTRRRIQQQAISLMYLRLKLFNPDAILNTLEPIFRPVLNRWGLLAWFVLVVTAFLSIIPQWSRLVGRFDEYVSPANYGWIMVVFVALKLWHEMGHGLICKRFGGQVPEAGVMMLVLLPAPYVDASACWAFPSKWQRAAVGAGGVIFELFIASLAAFTWLLLPDGTLAKQLAYYAMLTSSIATLLFNLNPLMRFDGYYILADLLEIPNLMQRSQQMVSYFFQKYIFRMERVRSPSTLHGERAILIVFGLAALAFRLFVFFSILLWLVGSLFIIGLFLAAWSLATWFVIPTGKFIHWLATSPGLAERRPQALAASLAMGLLGAILLGAIPFPDWRRAPGVIESDSRTGIFFQTDGFVENVRVRSGQALKAGDVLATLSSPELERTRRNALASIDEANVMRDEYRGKDDAASAGVISAQLVVLHQQLDEVNRRIEAMVIRAPHDGVVVGKDPMLALGAYVKRGDGFCEIVDTHHLRVAASLGQGDGAWFNELPRDAYDINIRLVSDPWHVVEGGRAWSPTAAQHELPHSALGYAGGGQIETDRRDERGKAIRQPRFTVYIEPREGEFPGLPGERVFLRFTLPSKSIVSQVVDRLLKTIQGRVNL